MALLKFVLFVFFVILTSQNYSQIENDVLYWLNMVRANPAILIPHIQNQLDRFNGTMIPIAPYFNYATKQGAPVWRQTIQFLKKQKPVGTLERHIGLDRATSDHALDLKQHNTIRHEGTDGSIPSQRIQRYCIYEVGSISQNIAQQFIHESRIHGLQTVVSLIIDDGVLDRGHRFSLFGPNFKYTGVSTQKTPTHYITVIKFSSHNLPLRSSNIPLISPNIGGFVEIKQNSILNNSITNQNNNIITSNPLGIHQNFQQFQKMFLQFIPQIKYSPVMNASTPTSELIFSFKPTNQLPLNLNNKFTIVQ